MKPSEGSKRLFLRRKFGQQIRIDSPDGRSCLLTFWRDGKTGTKVELEAPPEFVYLRPEANRQTPEGSRHWQEDTERNADGGGQQPARDKAG